MKPIPNLISAGLMGLGVAGFAISSRPLLKNDEIDVPLNVLGINRSPFGEVFAMAMQGPIDNYWHAVESSGAHVCQADCNHETPEKPDTETKQVSESTMSWNVRVRRQIERMSAGLEERTNPRAASDAHKFYLRRGIEDKLRFAYNLDPSHYGNYNAYHFFLTQPTLGTRPELTPHATKLAFDTINYCLSKRNDPRQALTAAAAAGNVLELMLNDRSINPENPGYTTTQMRQVLNVMDQSIAAYGDLANKWADQGLWLNLSEMRVLEIQERFYFVTKIREAHAESILRLEGGSMKNNTANQPTNRDLSEVH